MKKLWLLLIITLLSTSSMAMAGNLAVGDIGATKPENSEVRMTIITKKGHVSFKVGESWKIINAQGKPPIANLSFQISNAADAGTIDSTNLAVTLIYSNDENSKKALGLIGKKYGASEVITGSYKGWKIYSQEALQGSVTYTIADATQSIADVVVHVRLAWPHLTHNDVNYKKNMKATFNNILDSVGGGTGTYQAQKGEVFRRQN